MQEQDIPYGYCHCGCGEKTRISPATSREKGWIRGVPRRYINGHNGRKYTFDYAVDAAGCWIWLGSKTWNGYGQGCHEGKPILGHIWWYEHLVGPVPSGLQLDHLCRNRACVNPTHLEPVTAKVNARRGNQTILTEQQAREIKLAPRPRGSGRALAERYGVHECTISAIRHGRLWPDVT